MAFFVPCDDVNIKMYFASLYLDKYNDSTFYSMCEWKKNGMNLV